MIYKGGVTFLEEYRFFLLPHVSIRLSGWEQQSSIENTYAFFSAIRLHPA